jgi:hypothetical protein
VSRPASLIPRVVVEDCEIVNVSDVLRCVRLGLQFDTVPTRGRGQRFCLLCPRCRRRAFKLYKPRHLQAFACRACHNLSYTSVQKHDVRLDQLLKVSLGELRRLIIQDKNMVWKLLAIRAGYIRLGLISKY